MTARAGGVPSAPAGYPPAAHPVPPGPAPVVRSAAVSRRTSRRGLIGSVLVVLLGGLVAFAGARMLTGHTQVLAVARNVPVGSTITDADLAVADVSADPNLSPIPATQRSRVVGMVAQVGLVQGELLTRAQVGRDSGLAPRQMLAALPLKQGQFPARGLAAGQKVLLVATPGTTAAGAGTSGGVAGPAGQGIAATVADVGALNPATQVTVVDVTVSAGDGVAVAALASTGNLAVILLPAGA